MTRVRWFAVPSVAAEDPAEQEWSCIDDASIASSGHLAQLVLAQAGLPPTTALWLQRKGGRERVSSLAELPSGDLVVKAVVRPSGGHYLCKESPRLDVWMPDCSDLPRAGHTFAPSQRSQRGAGVLQAVAVCIAVV